MWIARSKTSLITAVLLGCCLLGAWAYFRREGGAQYRTMPAERGSIDSTISATGNPNAVVTVQVGSQVSGNILALYADFNSKVQKGQLIARIDPQVFQARVDAAQATVASARAALLNAEAQVQKSQADSATAQANVMAARDNTQKAKVTVVDSKSKLDRRVKLADEGVLSKEDRETAQATYDESLSALSAAQAQEQAAQAGVRAAQSMSDIARTQVAGAQAQLRQAIASLQQAQVDLDHTFIKAPVDGTVVSRQVNVGQTVAASLAAPTLFDIAQDLTKMQVDTNVDEADIGRVQMGQNASFTVDAYPKRVFRGVVTAIRKAPINTQNVITYDVVISVGNDDLKLFPGMTANVKILVDHRDDALKIANAALRYRPAATTAAATTAADAPAPSSDRTSRNRRATGAAQSVWVLGVDGKPHPVAVQLGITDGTWTEVKSGDLHPGDVIILGALTKEEATSNAASPFGGGQNPRRRGAGF